MSAIVESNRMLSINKAVEEVRANTESNIKNSIEYHRRTEKETIAEIETCRLAALLLESAGIEFDTGWCKNGRIVRIELGFFTTTGKGNARLAFAVRRIREALGCRLKLEGKEIASEKKKHIQFSLQPEAFPGVEVRYTRRLDKSMKCKIVSRRSYHKALECELA